MASFIYQFSSMCFIMHWLMSNFVSVSLLALITGLLYLNGVNESECQGISNFIVTETVLLLVYGVSVSFAFLSSKKNSPFVDKLIKVIFSLVLPGLFISTILLSVYLSRISTAVCVLSGKIAIAYVIYDLVFFFTLICAAGTKLIYVYCILPDTPVIELDGVVVR